MNRQYLPVQRDSFSWLLRDEHEGSQAVQGAQEQPLRVLSLNSGLCNQHLQVYTKVTASGEHFALAIARFRHWLSGAYLQTGLRGHAGML